MIPAGRRSGLRHMTVNEMRKAMNQHAMRDTMRKYAMSEKTHPYAEWDTMKAQRDAALAEVDVLRGRLSEMEAEVARLHATAKDRLVQQDAVQDYARGHKHRADIAIAELAYLRARIGDLAD